LTELLVVDFVGVGADELTAADVCFRVTLVVVGDGEGLVVV